MLPFEFIVEGPPVSLQTKNRARLQAWKAKVNSAATNALTNGAVAITDEVTFKVTYYYEGDSPDADNIIKPMQDALVGVVYLDDDQVVETSARKRNINGAYKIKGASPVIIEGFLNGVDFLHIKVEEFQHNQELD
ncbi:RusA family crossover junction endodeoxyribonuclease [Maribacter halichondriae]|uniref:RusA family crossover junction endodeoxyribonuclease n=1 Tax=Maribacter halichondriae TaxID=2980554 RepID=UPI00235A2EAB|nr:RusA family crossover junction endodeoxyribonuclease [Maribacter sp. Hal144]